MRGLEHGRLLPDVRAGRHTKAADEAGAQVGDDVAVQVGQDEDVVLLGSLDELHREVVHDAVVEADVRVVLGHPSRRLQEQPVRELHDVRLVHRRDLRSAIAPRVVEGEPDDPLRPPDRDRLDRDAGVVADALPGLLGDELDQLLRSGRSLLELDPRVQVLGVLPDDHDVYVLVPGSRAPVPLARPEAGVQVELLSKRHVHAPKAASHRGGDGALDGHSVPPDRLQDGVGKGRAVPFQDVGAGLLDVPVEPHPGGLEDPAGGLRELRADAISRDERHAVRRHARLLRTSSASLIPGSPHSGSEAATASSRRRGRCASGGARYPC